MRIRDEKKESLIKQKAIEMIVKYGFDGLSMQKLAKAAKVSPATIYIYFKDRNHVFTGASQTLVSICDSAWVEIAAVVKSNRTSRLAPCPADKAFCGSRPLCVDSWSTIGAPLPLVLPPLALGVAVAAGVPAAFSDRKSVV